MTLQCLLSNLQPTAAREVMKELERVQSSDKEKKAYEEYLLYTGNMTQTTEWEGLPEVGHPNWSEREDLNEMFDEMNVFEKDLNLQLQLSVPHEFRPTQQSGALDKITSSDTMTTEVKVSKRGDKYWTGDSDFGKIFIPLNLTHHIHDDSSVKMNVKVMGSHVQIPLRAFFIHRAH
jgi:hypothetical protein